MGEWKGPRKCEGCGAITGKDWAGEIEYDDGHRYHFTNRGTKKGIRPIMCDGEMKPYDRRAPDPRVDALVKAAEEAVNILRSLGSAEELKLERALAAMKGGTDG